MKTSICLKIALLGSAFGLGTITSALAEQFNIPAGDLNTALSAYANTTGTQLVVSADAVRGVRTKGVSGDYSVDAALSRILTGTGFIARHRAGASIIVRDQSSSASEVVQDIQMAQGAPARTAVETVTVTSSKLGGADVQSIPIAITALSQEQLTATQTAGGPDLVKQVPNLTFTKTNFSGYSINIRGIGTQAISVTTDPAVAVAMNDIPFIRNHFFEQEFFDVGQLEVLRGPQGTLYGRNATAGVVNITSAKPTDQFEAMASGEIGNYQQRRFEGMLNLPIVDDRLDIRLAGEWTKRRGYSFNDTTGQRIDGRDLWSGRATIGWKPIENLQTYLVWEHFSENDDRMRSAKQLCKRDPGLGEVDGVAIPGVGPQFGVADGLSQGCLPASPYSPESYETPNGQALAFFNGLKVPGYVVDIDPYASETQSRNLRVIESTLEPSYKAKNDIVELNAEYAVTPALTFNSQTGFDHDFMFSTEDYNRFNTAPGIFKPTGPAFVSTGSGKPLFPSRGQISDDGVFCDPQLGCSDKMVGEDLDTLKSWQLSQEFRLSSNFSGPFNFSVGGNYLHYEIDESYYVFFNSFTLLSSVTQQIMPAWQPGVSNNNECLNGGGFHIDLENPSSDSTRPLNCPYIDPNSIDNLDGNGHNYFRSHNPYVLNSYAGFGEAYYSVTPDLKLTGGLRWTDDQKHFPLIPSFLLVRGYGSFVEGVVDQSWSEFTGRAAANWTPHLNFTDQTLIYGSYAHGYKAGGANPPGAVLLQQIVGAGPNKIADELQPTHPLTFKPEFIDALELGSKNTLLDGALTFNASLFYYRYQDYQISEIVDRTSVNQNFNAHIRGVEVESSYEPVPGLRFNFAGGWQHSSVDNGQSAVDLMDRTAGNPDWVVVRANITQASNCIIPAYVVAENPNKIFSIDPGANGPYSACEFAYNQHVDPITRLTYTLDPKLQLNIVSQTGATSPFNDPNYHGFDPITNDPNAPPGVNNGLGLPPNNGEGFAKDLSGNELPNAPPFTISAGAQYTVPLSSDWAGTLRADYYWQDYSWARIFNDNPYDRLRGYTNVNLSVILTNQNGWQVMLYDKNVFNTTDITGAFLNSDDSGLTTNVFLTDPKLIGIRVTKNW